MVKKLENKKNNKKKPLKLSSSGRLQIRKNLGPSGSDSKNQGNRKTIQIVFRNKNNQQKSSSTAQSNFRGSSSLRTPRAGLNSSPQPNFSSPNKTRSFENKNKKNLDKKIVLKRFITKKIKVAKTAVPSKCKTIIQDKLIETKGFTFHKNYKRCW